MKFEIIFLKFSFEMYFSIVSKELKFFSTKMFVETIFFLVKQYFNELFLTKRFSMLFSFEFKLFSFGLKLLKLKIDF